MVIQILQVPTGQQVVWGRRQRAETGGSWGPRVLTLSETFIEHLLYDRGCTKYGIAGGGGGPERRVFTYTQNSIPALRTFQPSKP